jgi:hypothetical protein
MSDKHPSVAKADDLDEKPVALQPPMPNDAEEAGQLL